MKLFKRDEGTNPPVEKVGREETKLRKALLNQMKNSMDNDSGDYPIDFLGSENSGENTKKSLNNDDEAQYDEAQLGKSMYEITRKALAADPEKISKSMRSGKATNYDTTDIFGNDLGLDNTPLSAGSRILALKRQLYVFARNPVVQAILRTRDNQVSMYASPVRYSSSGIGYAVKPKKPVEVTDPNDETIKSKVDKQEKRSIELEEFIYNTGSEFAPQRDLFPEFLSSYIFNRYVYAQLNVEKIMKTNDKNKLDHFNILDSGRITLAKQPQHEERKRSFYQFSNFNGRQPRKLTEDQITFVTFNKAGSFYPGYGFSATEAAMQEISNENNAEEFNARFFTQGGSTKGVFLIDMGESNAQQSKAALQSIKRQWAANGTGNNGAWRTPMIVGHDAKFVNMQKTSQDLQFSDFLTYSINIISAHFTMRPDEINFPNRGGGATSRGTSSTMNEGNTARNNQQASEKTGLNPLLAEIERFINTYLMPLIDDDYYFTFVNKNSKDALAEQQLIKAKIENGLTFNEARALNQRSSLDSSDITDGINLYDQAASATAVQLMQLLKKDEGNDNGKVPDIPTENKTPKNDE